jgi:hypothetical protein
LGCGASADTEYTRREAEVAEARVEEGASTLWRSILELIIVIILVIAILIDVRGVRSNIARASHPSRNAW